MEFWQSVRSHALALSSLAKFPFMMVILVGIHPYPQNKVTTRSRAAIYRCGRAKSITPGPTMGDLGDGPMLPSTHPSLAGISRISVSSFKRLNGLPYTCHILLLSGMFPHLTDLFEFKLHAPRFENLQKKRSCLHERSI
jgi:hypothetical protein